MISEADLERILMLLINGVSVEKATTYCMTHLGLSEDKAKEAVSEARKKLTLAADFARDEQLGTAITRLNNIYTIAMRVDDIKTALQAQRELNKLMNLYGGPTNDNINIDEEMADTLETIEKYILPLNLVSNEYPIEEHVRVAAEIIRKYKKRKNISDK